MRQTLGQGSEEGTGIETNRMVMHGGCGCYMEHWREGIGSLGNALRVKKQPRAVVEKPLWFYCLFKQSSLSLSCIHVCRHKHTEGPNASEKCILR